MGARAPTGRGGTLLEPPSSRASRRAAIVAAVGAWEMVTENLGRDFGKRNTDVGLGLFLFFYQLFYIFIIISRL